ncbi:proline-rich protein 15-like protein isoform X1 [Alligator mississippiensis]|uniref:Proline-rich protein 15-like protein n=2 Tax=Crocodylia TaxID=1294634 RepID=A0A151P5H5_ALLMI|nr:proline-rich protein 15-like protein isoform X1 [Alligator mississippiensis]KYO44321.1 proline-rich protein 15-like protein [Alligator mississippiensis]
MSPHPPPSSPLPETPSLRLKSLPPARGAADLWDPTLPFLTGRNKFHLLQPGGANMAENNYSWWKLTFLRKKKSAPKVLYESPDIYANENQQEGTRAEAGGGSETNCEFNARLEKIVDKNTKGKHVKVSHSGRFKEKKKVRSTLAENPNLYTDGDREEK